MISCELCAEAAGTGAGAGAGAGAPHAGVVGAPHAGVVGAPHTGAGAGWWGAACPGTTGAPRWPGSRVNALLSLRSWSDMA